ncbi:MAG: hypothetical protein JW841_00720 [Deltaproteobacteria bacterium]|nr:hypothetical protein [Deltaproteobacteria bacterium]
MIALPQSIMTAVVVMASLHTDAPNYCSECISEKHFGRIETGMIWRRGTDKEHHKINQLNERISLPQAYLAAQWNNHFFDMGVLTSWQEHTYAQWNLSRGQLVTKGPQNQAGIDEIYLRYNTNNLDVILGSYHSAFGEKLTFASTNKNRRNNFWPNIQIETDNYNGKIYSSVGLFGLALTINKKITQESRWQATIIGSRRTHDIYQYNGIWYAYDDDVKPTCNSDADCRAEYTCDDILKYCRSSAVFNIAKPATDKATGKLVSSFHYLTINNAFRETLVAGNIAYYFHEENNLGFTIYRSKTDILLASKANPSFARSSRYPNTSSFGAIGVHLNINSSLLLFSSEYANTGGNGHAGFGRLIIKLPPVKHLEFALRYYDARYVNPHGFGEAALDQEQGLTARNEMGLRNNIQFSIFKKIVSSTDLNFWRRTHNNYYDPDGKQHWIWVKGLHVNSRIQQRFDYDASKYELISIKAKYESKSADIYDELDNSAKIYENSAESTDNQYNRYTLTIGLKTKRIAYVLLAAIANTATYDNEFANFAIYQQQYKLKAELNIPTNSKIGLACSFRTKSIKSNNWLSSNEYLPTYSINVWLHQQIYQKIRLVLYYGIIKYANKRPDQFSCYHLAKMQLTVKF